MNVVHNLQLICFRLVKIGSLQKFRTMNYKCRWEIVVKIIVLWGYVDNDVKMPSSHRPMLVVGILLGLACSLSLTKLLLCVFAEINPGLGDKTEADVWLQENDLQQYQSLFRERGMCDLTKPSFLIIIIIHMIFFHV